MVLQTCASHSQDMKGVLRQCMSMHCEVEGICSFEHIVEHLKDELDGIASFVVVSV